jgi:hypothetical protein
MKGLFARRLTERPHLGRSPSVRLLRNKFLRTPGGRPAMEETGTAQGAGTEVEQYVVREAR